MKFTVEAVDEFGNPGKLTIKRGPKNVLEYWSFHAHEDRNQEPEREEGAAPDQEPGRSE